MNTMNKKLPTCLLYSLMTLSSTIIADETDLEQSFDHSSSQSGGYAKIGIGYRFETTPYASETNDLDIFLEASYQWQNGFFIEAPGVTNKLNPGLTFGYNFYNNEHWNFDLIGQQSHGDIIFNYNDDVTVNSLEREPTYRAGIRATGNYGQNTIQFNITPLSGNDEYDDGLYASIWFAKEWQVKNWSIHTSLGLQYRSEEILDYYYGVSEEDALGPVTAYTAGDGINASFQIGADYPIAENWLFESYVRYINLDDSINNSPIIQLAVATDSSRSENIAEAGIFFNYVF